MNLDWIANSWLNGVMMNNAYMFPLFEIIHFIGLCLMLGALTVVDCRLLGMAGNMSISAAKKFVNWAIAGFSINVVTGIGFFFADPYRYYPNIAFHFKMLFILLAGLNLLWYQMTVGKRLSQQGDNYQPTIVAKLTAGISLTLWVGVILFGRLIPYVE